MLWKWSFIPLSALRLTRHPTGHSTAGISAEIHQSFASLCLLPRPSPVTAAPGLCTTQNMGWDQNIQAPVSGKLLVPECAAAALVGGESPGPWAQWCSSLTASCSGQKYFYLVLSHSDRVWCCQYCQCFFWWPSRNSGSSLPFRVKAWYSADSDWSYQQQFSCLLFTSYIWLGYFSQIPILLLWLCSYWTLK